MQGEHGIDLLVIDPLAHFLRCENNTASVLESIMPLRELTRRGMAVLVLITPARAGNLWATPREVPALCWAMRYHHRNAHPAATPRRAAAAPRHSRYSARPPGCCWNCMPTVPITCL